MNYEKIELGKLDEITEKIFLHDDLHLTGSEISINHVEKGFEFPFLHKHKNNEEVYIILKGEGTISVDNEEFQVKEGSIVRIAPEGIRTLRNSTQSDMIFIVIQTQGNSLEGYTMTDGIVI